MCKKTKQLLSLPDCAVLALLHLHSFLQNFRYPSQSLCRTGWHYHHQESEINLPTRAIRDKPFPFSAYTDSSVITELITLLPQAFPKINVSFLEKSCFLDCVRMVYLCGVKEKKKKAKNPSDLWLQTHPKRVELLKVGR